MIINNDVQFRRGIFNILFTLKSHLRGNEFNEIIEELQEKLEQLPTNDLEQSKQFFFEVTNKIMQGLSDYYNIAHEQVNGDVVHGDVFTLKMDENTSEMIETYNKYKNMARFRDSFLQSYNYDFWRRFRTNYYNPRISDVCTAGEDKSLVFRTNEIPATGPLFLPKDRNGKPVGVTTEFQYFSSLISRVNSEKKYIDDLREDYETLNKAVKAFDERLQASLREEHIRFGIIHLKEILSKIVIPVALIEDDELRELCKEHNRQVFVKTPTLDDLMYIGSSVHIYSSHDISDDSSYVAKPIMISETLPTDTEELKYLGVGQYTGYDDESPRSLEGANPFIINNNIFVKASYEDFLPLIPEELVEDMGICKNLVDSLENPVEDIQLEENETLKSIIDTIKEDQTLDYKKIIDDFMASSTYFENEEDKETGPVFIHAAEYQFEKSNLSFNRELLKKTGRHPNGYLILKDNTGNHAGIRMNEEGISEIYINTDIDKIFKALQLNAGLYTIYSFRHREMSRQRAILTMQHYTG
ncbi:hypothetical protein PDL67_10955 [Bacillus cereus]|nr:hypothetical protein [Bacillus cereus]